MIFTSIFTFVSTDNVSVPSNQDINPNVGQGLLSAVRITNASPHSLTITNVVGQNVTSSMPAYQQNVYAYTSGQGIINVAVLPATTNDTATYSVVFEFSDNPSVDFTGQYPVPLSAPQVIVSGGSVQIASGTVNANITGNVNAVITNASIPVNGTVDIGTIQAGQVIEVINSPNTNINTQSLGINVRNTYIVTPPTGNSTQTAIITIPTSSHFHAFAFSGIYNGSSSGTLSPSSMVITLIGVQSGIQYYSYSYTYQPWDLVNFNIPQKVSALSSLDSELEISIYYTLNGTPSSQSLEYNFDFYSESIPPDPKVTSDLDSANATLSSILTNIQNTNNLLIGLYENSGNLFYENSYSVPFYILNALPNAGGQTVQNWPAGISTFLGPSSSHLLIHAVTLSIASNAAEIGVLFPNGYFPIASRWNPDYNIFYVPIPKPIYIPPGNTVEIYTEITTSIRISYLYTQW